MSHNILMLEDDQDDLHITRTFFQEQQLDISLQVVHHADQVIPYLDSCLQQGIKLPDLILLDKNMPAINGTEALKAIKAHRVYTLIPVIIISGSDLQNDIDECYQLGASSYIVKPVTALQTAHKISTFLSYWFTVAELPRPRGYQVLA